MADNKLAEMKTSNQSGRSIWATLRRAVLIYAGIPYLVIAGGFVVLQRPLLYPGTKDATIETADALCPDGPIHDIAITSDDGLQLNGWLALAGGHLAHTALQCDEQLGKGRPLVLFFSGNGGYRVDWIHACRAFTGLGMDAVLFDYRGYGDNPGKPSEPAITADALAIWNYLLEERNVSHQRIIVVGRSLGGGVATRLVSHACQNDQPPAGLVLVATFSSMTDTAASHYPLLPIRLALLDRYESSKYIGSVTCPIAMVHGTADQIVPFRLGKKLFAATPHQSASGIAKSFQELSGQGHEFSGSIAIPGIVQQMADASILVAE